MLDHRVGACWLVPTLASCVHCLYASQSATRSGVVQTLPLPAFLPFLLFPGPPPPAITSCTEALSGVCAAPEGGGPPCLASPAAEGEALTRPAPPAAGGDGRAVPSRPAARGDGAAGPTPPSTGGDGAARPAPPPRRDPPIQRGELAGPAAALARRAAAAAETSRARSVSLICFMIAARAAAAPALPLRAMASSVTACLALAVLASWATRLAAAARALSSTSSHRVIKSCDEPAAKGAPLREPLLPPPRVPSRAPPPRPLPRPRARPRPVTGAWASDGLAGVAGEPGGARARAEVAAWVTAGAGAAEGVAPPDEALALAAAATMLAA